MSNASQTKISSKREKKTSDLVQELDSIKALNRSLEVYLENLKMFKGNLLSFNENCLQMSKVNKEWVRVLGSTKK